MKKKENIFAENLKLSKEIFIIGPLFKKSLKITNKESSFLFIDGGSHFFEDIQQTFFNSFDDEAATHFNSLRIGDGDSYQGVLDIKLSINKNFSDLAYGLKFIKTSLEKVNLLGFLGGRKDHELFNLGEAHKVLLSNKVNRKVKFLFDQSFIGFPPGRHTLKLDGIFSLFVIEEAEITITGQIKYPLISPTKVLPLSSQGLSNVGNGEFFIQSNKPVFLYIPPKANLNDE